jgi:capsular exopolysaccharide synthesis family protein
VNISAEERGTGARYLAAIRANWALIVLIVAVGVATAAVYSAISAKRYEAKADLFVTPIDASDDTFLGIGVLRESPGDPNRGVITAARFVKTQQVAEAVRARLVGERNGALTTSTLLSKVKAEPVGQANVVAISASAPTAQGAAVTANAFAAETIAQRTAAFQQQLKSVIDGLTARLEAIPSSDRDGFEAVGIRQRLGRLTPLVGQPDPTLTFLTRASPPDSPAWPRPLLSIVVALVASALLGTGLAVARELMSPRVSEDELLFDQRLPILARIPRLTVTQLRDFLSHRQPPPAEVREAFRMLRANLGFAGRDGGLPHTILVTSSISGEGKTLACANLAMTIAAGGERVLLIDGDLRRPMVATVFGVPSQRSGLVDVMFGNVRHDATIVNAPEYANLRLLLSNSRDAEQIDVVEPAHAERIIEELKHEVDVIIIDSSPLTEVADALIWASSADTILVAVRIGRSRRDKLDELQRTLARQGVDLAGIVLTTNDQTRKRPYYGGAPDLRRLQRMTPPSRAGGTSERRAASGDIDHA